MLVAAYVKLSTETRHCCSDLGSRPVRYTNYKMSSPKESQMVMYAATTEPPDSELTMYQKET
jgi:hypothetical protein